MTIYGLDDLSKSLKSTLDESRKKLDQKQTERLKNIINIDRTGQLESMSWECRLPAGDGSEFNFEMLRIPWASLNQAEIMNITGLSVEIDCKIKKSSHRSGKNQPEYTAIPVSRDKAGKNTHKITFDINQQQQETSVSIDGITVEKFLEEQFPPEQKHEEPADKKNNFIKVIIILLSLFLIAAVSYLFFCHK